MDEAKRNPLNGDTSESTPDTLQHNLFGPSPVPSVLVEDNPNTPIGYTALTRAACDLAAAAGCSFITVSASPGNILARAFYPRMGFAAYTPKAARFCSELMPAA